MQHDLQFTRSNELKWLALRYVSGEMDEAEVAEFEQQLADDQAACEAVASAVQTALAVQAAFEARPLPVPSQTVPSQTGVYSEITEREHIWSQPATPARHVRWVSVTTAAAAVIAVLFTLSFRSDSPGVPSVVPGQKRDLAVLWTQTGGALPDFVDQTESTSADDGHRPPAETARTPSELDQMSSSE